MLDFCDHRDEDLLAWTPAHPDAFGVVAARRCDLILSYFGERVTDPALAADLAAETFAAALLCAPRYRRRGPAAGWLLGIARAVLRRSLRTGRVQGHARRRLGLLPEHSPAVCSRAEAVRGPAPPDRYAQLPSRLGSTMAVRGRTVEATCPPDAAGAFGAVLGEAARTWFDRRRQRRRRLLATVAVGSSVLLAGAMVFAVVGG